MLITIQSISDASIKIDYPEGLITIHGEDSRDDLLNITNISDTQLDDLNDGFEVVVDVDPDSFDSFFEEWTAEQTERSFAYPEDNDAWTDMIQVGALFDEQDLADLDFIYG